MVVCKRKDSSKVLRLSISSACAPLACTSLHQNLHHCILGPTPSETVTRAEPGQTDFTCLITSACGPSWKCKVSVSRFVGMHPLPIKVRQHSGLGIIATLIYVAVLWHSHYVGASGMFVHALRYIEAWTTLRMG